MIRTTVVGNPDNRRVALHAAAVRAAGLPAPRVLPWLEVLTTLREHGPSALPGFAPGEIVRIDSPGEDAEVDALLRGAGDPTRVEGSGRWYAQFTAAARAVAGRARSDGARLLDDPDELAVMFDKRLSHGVLREAAVPVPESPTSGPAAPLLRGWEDVRAAGLARFFVKPAHGSSASGVMAVQWGPAGRIRAVTSVERDSDGRLFNSLRVRTLTAEAEIGRLVDALAPDGLHLERWWPKASQGDRPVDLRVVVVAGRATHAVLRAGRSPMTNLHLGGVRGDLAAAREAAGPVWQEALAVCERAASLFPGTHCVGVDLLPSVRWERVAVGEVNAFGDLLPRLTGLPGSGAEGLDTYGAQVAALLRGVHRRGPTAAARAAAPLGSPTATAAGGSASSEVPEAYGVPAVRRTVEQPAGPAPTVAGTVRAVAAGAPWAAAPPDGPAEPSAAAAGQPEEAGGTGGATVPDATGASGDMASRGGADQAEPMVAMPAAWRGSAADAG